MGLDLGQIATIGANVGVIAGLVFLAMEIRQNNKLLAAARQKRTPACVSLLRVVEKCGLTILPPFEDLRNGADNEQE